jgi:hypothetical protein
VISTVISCSSAALTVRACRPRIVREHELAEDVSEVRLHRSPGNGEAVGNIAVPEPIGDQLSHRALRGGQAVPAGIRACSRAVAAAGSAQGSQRGADTRKVPSCPEPFEDVGTLSKVSQRASLAPVRRAQQLT